MPKTPGISGSGQVSNLVEDKKSAAKQNKVKWNSRQTEQADTRNGLPSSPRADKFENQIHDRSARLSTSSTDSGRKSLTSNSFDSDFESTLPFDENDRNNSIDEGFSEPPTYSPVPLKPDKVILRAELGSGQFGKVHRVEEQYNNQDSHFFAFKTVRGQSEEEKKSNFKKIQREIQVLKALGEHSNIVQCEGLVRVDGKEGARFGLIAGPDLTSLNNNICELFENGKISLEELNDTFAFLEKEKLNAMTHLQKKGFVHGDLKPSNFMWDSNSRSLKLIDFGQSVSCGEKVVCGHEDYTPPEAIDSLQGSAHAVTAEVTIDSYALGQMQFMMYNYLMGGQGNAFNNGAKTEGLAPGQRGEKAFFLKQAMKDFTKPNDDGSYKKVIVDVSFDELMMQISEKDQPESFDPLYDKATKIFQTMQVLKPMADYTCHLMHPIADKRATAEEMLNHPWVTRTNIDDKRAMAIIGMTA